MRQHIIAALSLSALCASTAFAKISIPQEVVSRYAEHCQAPQWAPNGKQLAIDIYNPKKEAREVWVVHLTDRLVQIKEEQVKPLGQQTSRLNGGKSAPVVEFTWTPDMETLNPPYLFSSQSPQRKNFDIYGDGTWLTKNKGNDGQPAISPDANFLAYTSQQSESGDIMMIDFTGDIEQPIHLTNTPQFTEYHPQWHPTQSKLSFIRFQKSRGQDIMIIDDPKSPAATTRELTNWLADEIRPHWSPDGEWIAFYSNHQNKNDKIFDLWVIKADGTQAKRLAQDVHVDDHKGAVWSKDSSTVFFVKRDFERKNPIMWVKRTGGPSKVLIDTTEINSDLSIHYMDSGDMALAFRAAGLKTSDKKTWQRIYVVTFTMDDLR
jgi:Tol biopolymer transport system component